MVALHLGGGLGKKQFMDNLVDTQNYFLKKILKTRRYFTQFGLIHRWRPFFFGLHYFEGPLRAGVGGGPGQMPKAILVPCKQSCTRGFFRMKRSDLA